MRENRDGLDLEVVLQSVRAIEKNNLGGVDPEDIAKGVAAYRSNINKEFRNRKKLINDWYDDRIQDARDLNLIDKNIVNANRLKKIDDINHSLDQGIVNYKDVYEALFESYASQTARNEILRKTYGINRDQVFKEIYQIRSAKELREKYPTRNSVRDLVEQFEDRWRELTPQDILRKPKPGEALYGVGP